MPDFQHLPNFMIIGAPKAGTTSVFNALTAHPQVYPSPVKEPGFFNNDERYRLGANWYASTFFSAAGGFSLRMEATPAYLTWSEKTAPRIAAMFAKQDIKFCAVFRDPVARAYSHFWHRVRLGHEDLSFSDAISKEEDRLKTHYDELFTNGDGRYGYFRAGCYASRLAPFLQHFDPDQFIFLLQEDLYPDNFPQTGQRLCDFLQLDPEHKLIFQRDNPAVQPRTRWIASLYWRLKSTLAARIYRQFFRRETRQSIHHSLFSPTPYPPIDEEIASFLRARYQDEIRSLEAIIGRDLSAWLNPGGE